MGEETVEEPGRPLPLGLALGGGRGGIFGLRGRFQRRPAVTMRLARFLTALTFCSVYGRGEGDIGGNIHIDR
jgi:hypothetical protein